VDLGSGVQPRELRFLAISVGNTRTRLGVCAGEHVEPSEPVASRPDTATDAVIRLARSGDPPDAVVIASVNDPIADAIEAAMRAAGVAGGVYRVGRDLPIPIQTALDEPGSVGQDRLLTALGAYRTAKQACAVIDAGTAVTVDFVDGEGVFCGGAIAPGVRMMLRALHEQTAALPLVEPAPDEDLAPGVFGTDTRAAMLLGVHAAIRGMARLLVERYAEHYGAFPQVVATGGDAERLFAGDGLVEHVVPELHLMGIAAACHAALSGGD
jgi:type III pantothenate kinase